MYAVYPLAGLHRRVRSVGIAGNAMINNDGSMTVYCTLAPALTLPSILGWQPRDAIKPIRASSACRAPMWPVAMTCISASVLDPINPATRSFDRAPPLFSGGVIQWRGIKTHPSRWIMREVEFEISGEVSSAVKGAQGNAATRWASPQSTAWYYVVRSNKFQKRRRWNLIDVTCNGEQVAFLSSFM